MRVRGALLPGRARARRAGRQDDGGGDVRSPLQPHLLEGAQPRRPRVQREAPAVPHEAHGGARRGQVRAHKLGRGGRDRRRQAERVRRGVRPRVERVSHRVGQLRERRAEERRPSEGRHGRDADQLQHRPRRELRERARHGLRRVRHPKRAGRLPQRQDVRVLGRRPHDIHAPDHAFHPRRDRERGEVHRHRPLVQRERGQGGLVRPGQPLDRRGAGLRRPEPPARSGVAGRGLHPRADRGALLRQGGRHVPAHERSGRRAPGGRRRSRHGEAERCRPVCRLGRRGGRARRRARSEAPFARKPERDRGRRRDARV